MKEEINLRQYQLDSVEGLRDGIRRGLRNQVLCSPTGSGKTVIAMYLIDECMRKGKRAVFVCERVSLINQTSAVLDRYGIDHGVLQGNHWRSRPGEPIQVATAQTLRRRGWPRADLIIVDECHVMMQDSIKKIEARDCVTIGLTATPFSKGMGKVYDGIVNVTTSNKLTEDGFLVPFKVFAASEPDMTGAKVNSFGEWTDEEASTRSMPIIGDCVKEYLQHGNGGKFIAFGVDVSHCAEMRRQFMAAGVVCELHTYQEADSIRDEHMKEFRKSDSYIRGLISVSALSRGLDVPDVNCIVMCRPLRSSLAEFIQIIGRGLRPYEGKEHCVILDHSGNTMRFWPEMQEFFEMGVHELDDGTAKEKPKKKEQPEKTPVKCPKCFNVHKRMPNCPVCGYEYPRKPSVTHEAGELQEVGKVALATRDTKQAWFSMLLHMAQARGKSDGWISHTYKAKFGVWPKGLDYTPAEPTQEVRNYVTSRNIAYFKQKEKEAKSA